MNGHQIDELLKRKVDNARRGRTLRNAAFALALLALIVLIGTAVHRHKAKSPNVPDDPSTAETENETSPDEPGAENVHTKDGQKPLQPEEIRRLQNKHELVLVWVGVPEEERPSVVSVTVLHKGEEAVRFTLSAEDEWRHSWSDGFKAEELSLRANLPTSVMASFVLEGNQFTITGFSGSAAASDESEEADGETSGDGETPAQDDSNLHEGAPDSDAQAQDGIIEQPSENAQDEDAQDEEASEDVSDAPRPAHSWWPIVLLMLCGAVLVTLGMLGTDRRRSK